MTTLIDLFALMYFLFLVVVFSILIVYFVLPKVYCFLLDREPIWLIIPVSDRGAVLKKYVDSRIVENCDKRIINECASLGLVYLGLHEERLPDGHIDLVRVARTTPNGLHLLRYKIY